MSFARALVRRPPVVVRGVLALCVVLALSGIAAQRARADAPLGSLAGSVTFSQDCGSGIGVGIAYDGANLWYSCYASSPDLLRADPATGTVTASYTIQGGLGSLAYDATRNALWAAWGGPNEGSVQLIQLDAGKNVVDHHVAFSACPSACFEGLDDGIAYDAGDDSVYISPDTSQTIYKFTSSGTLMSVFPWAGNQCYNSGLAIGGNLLFEGSDGCSHVYVVDKSAPSSVTFDFATAVSGDPNFRDEGLACDPDTFAAQGEQVMWSKEAYSPMRAHAFVVPTGTCGAGGQPISLPTQHYAALGDSYQSGVGSENPQGYEDGTNVDHVNKCQRSPNAYAHLLELDGAVSYPLDFVACGGAHVHHLYDPQTISDGNGGQVVENPPQQDALDENTGLVTVGLGGNDIGFGPDLTSCIEGILDPFSCEHRFSSSVTDAILALESHNTPNHLSALQQAYADIRTDAPHARVLVTDYPHFFQADGGAGLSTIFSGLLNGFQANCAGIRISDQLWINYEISQLDLAIESSAQSMGVEPVSMYHASDGHELCAGGEQFLNGVALTNSGDSFHPLPYGQRILANLIEQQLQFAPLANSYTIYPAQTLTQTFEVPSATPQISFNNAWPGSDVVMSLRSPSGRKITRSTTAVDVYHQLTSTHETYLVDQPEPGTWTVTLYGANVAPGGESDKLSAYVAPLPHQDPVASFSQSLSRHTVTVDASASHAVTGSLSSYLWDFGDGTYATGATATHKYETAGTYTVTLTVQDDSGALGFADGAAAITIPTYKFTGFLAPVNNEPIVNTTRAGSAVPVKFSLDGDQGLDIFASGSPSSQPVDCVTGAAVAEVGQTVTAGSSALQYDPTSDTYTYVWKTDKNWSGTCRQLSVKLDDGTTHTASFQFR